MPDTPAARASAAWVISGVHPPTVTPGLDSPTIRQNIGWGYIGVPVLEGEAPEPEADFTSFVYRPIRRRLRARKRRF